MIAAFGLDLLARGGVQIGFAGARTTLS